MAARDAVPDADAAPSASLCPSSTAAPFVYAPYTSAESDIVPSYWVQRYEDEAARYPQHGQSARLVALSCPGRGQSSEHPATT